MNLITARSYGFIDYEHEHDAAAAKDKVDGSDLDENDCV